MLAGKKGGRRKCSAIPHGSPWPGGGRMRTPGRFEKKSRFKRDGRREAARVEHAITHMRGIRPDIVANDTTNAPTRMLLEAKTNLILYSKPAQRTSQGLPSGGEQTTISPTQSAL
jgi:hypothetical protein